MAGGNMNFSQKLYPTGVLFNAHVLNYNNYSIAYITLVCFMFVKSYLHSASNSVKYFHRKHICAQVCLCLLKVTCMYTHTTVYIFPQEAHMR